MKKILLAVAMLFAGISLAAAQDDKGIQFEHGTFAEALAKAKAEDKLLFVDVYAEWCGPCKVMASRVFTQQAVGDHFNAEYINYKIDAEKGEGPSVARRYNVKAYPTFLLLDGDGRLVGTMVGGAPAEEFVKKISSLAANDK